MIDPRKRKKRIMREFVIDEISAVDFPAQRGATVAIMKREYPTQYKRESLHLKETIKGNNTMHRYSTFEEAYSEIAKAEELPLHVAMSKARAEFPYLYEQYQSEGIAIMAKREAEERAQANRIAKVTEEEAVRNLEIAEYAEEHKCSRVEACRRLRHKFTEA